jgi:DNA repair exonuclease SbcCD ATPase subunit
MITEINEEILVIKEKLRENKKLKSLKKTIQEELGTKKIQQKELKKILEKERKDFEKLEDLSLSSILLSLTGKKEEKLDKEKEEYIIAKLRYEDCIKQINELETQLDDTNQLLINYEEVDKRYEDLIKEKEELLIREGGNLGNKLKNKILNIDQLKVDMKELREAINAGKDALRSLNLVEEKLNSARNWGTWDILGGGLISNMAKHSAINEANNIAKTAQVDLKKFKKELSDINEFTSIQVNLSSFASFADFFFDGILSDWFVQSKIKDSLNNVNEAMREIEVIISDLNQNINKLENNLKELELKVKNILNNI